MNYKQGFSTTLLSLLVSFPAFSDLGNLYGSGKIGWAWEKITHIDNDSAFLPDAIPYSNSASESLLSYGGAVGYRFNTFMVPVRIEADYTYRNNLSYNPDPVYLDETGSMKSTLQSQNILGNVYVDIPLFEMFGLFVGGGGGLGFNRTTNKLIVDDVIVESTTDRNGVSWMATAGLSVLPTHWLALDLSYRYSGLGAVRWTDASVELDSNNFYAQEVFLTFRFTLPSRDFGGKPQPMPYKPKAQPIPEPEPAPVVRRPQTKAPAYKPTTKAPAYEPAPQKAPTYNPNRAKPVNKPVKKSSTGSSSTSK